jgi:hypothetical protein
MTGPEIRDATSAPSIPRPRPAESYTVEQDTTSEPSAARSAWHEQWDSAGSTRPRADYWDVATASWRSRGPTPPRGE